MKTFPTPSLTAIIALITAACLSAETVASDWPDNHWQFSHMRELYPTANIERTTSSAWTLTGEPLAPEDIELSQTDGGYTLADAIKAQSIDSLMVIKDGQVRVETYRGEQSPSRTHLMMSTTKSVVGTIAAILEARGQLDLSKSVDHYLPEMSQSAYRGESVRDVLDMRVGSKFNEDYEALDSDIAAYGCATGWDKHLYECDEDSPQGLKSYMQTIQRDEANDNRWVYKSIDTDVVGWVLERVSDKRLPELISDEIWKPMGAEFDADMMGDGLGGFFASGGMNAALRDYARFGQLILDGGRGIVPKAFIDELMNQPGDPTWPYPVEGAEPYYHSFWWGEGNGKGDIKAYGIHGQLLHIAPTENTLVAVFSSWDRADEEEDWEAIETLSADLIAYFHTTEAGSE